jgi:hypothetical protein
MLAHVDDRQKAFTEGLTREDRLLIAIRDELYEGSWEQVLEDIEARIGRKPFVFKLKTRLDEDTARVAKLRAFEREHSVDLRALLEELEGKPGDTGARPRPGNEEVGRGS